MIDGEGTAGRKVMVIGILISRVYKGELRIQGDRFLRWWVTENLPEHKSTG